VTGAQNIIFALKSPLPAKNRIVNMEDFQPQTVYFVEKFLVRRKFFQVKGQYCPSFPPATTPFPVIASPD